MSLLEVLHIVKHAMLLAKLPQNFVVSNPFMFNSAPKDMADRRDKLQLFSTQGRVGKEVHDPVPMIASTCMMMKYIHSQTI